VRRRTPEEFLQECQAEEYAVSKGRLKIFLGYASGVGKSQRMLLEARRRKQRGQDLVIAGLQPLVPPELEPVLAGMPVVATLRVAGVPVIDLDALLRRRPGVCVIDGLAYDNPPGLQNATRWQDAQTLLAAGISVIASVNIQYIAELRAQVEPITGKSVKETIPLDFLKGADEMEIVDAPPDRLGDDSRGLSKLREIALVVAADVVDHQLNDYLKAHGIEQQPGTQERILICVTPRSNLRDMLHTGKDVAERFHGQLLAAYVEQSGLSTADQAAVDEKLASARQAGAQVVMLQGEDPISAILDFARKNGITQLFIGHTQRKGVWSRLWGNPVERLIRNSQGMDVRIFPQ